MNHQTIYTYLLVSMTIIAGIAAYFAIQYDRFKPDDGTNLEYTLVICLNGNNVLYKALVEEARVGRDAVLVEETGGLQRFITGATCVTTIGTAAEFKAAEEAGKELGGADGADTPEDTPLDAPVS